MYLTVAQQFYLDLVQPPKVASYKAPHALRGTPPRPHYQRQPKMIPLPGTDRMIPRVRLFKGWRP
jgi:hypothetical protein